jgi:hypothetical protein
MTDFHDLLMQNYIASWDKQMTFANWLDEHGNPDWGFEMSVGKLTFGNVIALDAQLLGTESTSSQSWMWAWANTMSNIPVNLLQAANALRTYGDAQGISKFTTPSLPLNATNHGHHFSMVACAVLNANIYYRGPYQGGALFLLVKDPHFPIQVPNTPEHIVTTITQFASSVQTDNLRLFIAHYLRTTGLEVIAIDDVLTGQFADGSRVDVIFDKLNRLQQVKTHIKPRL